jgi:DNA-binding GntR family transcriptional regulator
MEAALARDTERAVALLGKHFEGTTRSLLASLPDALTDRTFSASTSLR